MPAKSTVYPPIEEVSAVTLPIWQGIVRGSSYSPPPQTDFTYTFPLPNGIYHVDLGFNAASTTLPAADQAHQTQNVLANGSVVLKDWNTLVNCGVNVACSPPTLNVTVTNKQLSLLFEASYASGMTVSSNIFDTPWVNLIRIVPEPANNTVTQVAGAPFDVKVFPNPWRQDKHTDKDITFANLPLDAVVSIFSVSGRRVKVLGPPTSVGTSLWDLTNDSGKKVASGIYLYRVTSSQFGPSKGKLAIIK
jgi:hypothetical protein